MSLRRSITHIAHPREPVVERWCLTTRRGEIVFVSRIDLPHDQAMILLQALDLPEPLRWQFDRPQAHAFITQLHHLILRSGGKAVRRV